MQNHLITSTAPAKIILFGEHAVVYGQPAIAVPVHQLRATASVEAGPPGSGLILVAVDLGRTVSLAKAPADDPLAAMARRTLAHLGVSPPDAVLTVRSTIPIASGLGSGAAVSAAIVRALAGYAGHELAPAVVSRLVYQVEKLHHGTPSGIDNIVIAFGMPVYFVRGRPPETFAVGAPLHFTIGDTGVASPTRVAVGEVRRGWKSEPERFERLFGQIGEIVDQAREMVASGTGEKGLGALMTRNHALLRQMGVSSPELERLVAAAQAAGARGAKLSGAGQGGNMVALVAPETQAAVADGLRQAGAARVINTTVPPTP